MWFLSKYQCSDRISDILIFLLKYQCSVRILDFMFNAHCAMCMILRQWSAFVSCSFSFPRTSVYDSRARERLRQIEEQKALALQLQNQVTKN